MAEISEAQTAETLIREMTQLQGRQCPECSGPLSAHEVLMSIALGCRNSPRCLPCLASTFDRDIEFLQSLLTDYLQQRECYRIAWEWADKHAPHSALGGASSHEPLPPKTERRASENPAAAPAASPAQGTTLGVANIEWDAGDMSCGDLVLELRLRLQAMRPGDTLKLCARDPGAPQDIPAWCRLTGHTLLQAQHPTYWIKRKE